MGEYVRMSCNKEKCSAEELLEKQRFIATNKGNRANPPHQLNALLEMIYVVFYSFERFRNYIAVLNHHRYISRLLCGPLYALRVS